MLQNGFYLEAMEPRLLLSADPLGGGGLIDRPDDGSIDNWTGAQDEARVLETLEALVADGEEPGMDQAGRSGSLPQPLDLDLFSDGTSDQPGWNTDLPGTKDIAQVRELVFLDSNTPDHQALLAGIGGDDAAQDLLIYLIDGERDGVSQISDILAQHSEISAVHLISHGSPGSLQLGSSVLNASTISSHGEALNGWGQSLAVDADLLIYGCDVAGSPDGEVLVAGLAALTGADVAASDDPTGATPLGGDWDLEYRFGSIETVPTLSTVPPVAWEHLLAIATFREGDVNSYAGTSDTYLDKDSPNDSSLGDEDDLTVYSGTRQALIHFDTLFSGNSGPIPGNAIINSATLTLDVSNQDNSATISLHRMLTGWGESTTWNDLGSGVDLDGIEAVATVEDAVDGGDAIAVFDVTDSLSAWSQGGQVNHGWVLVSDNTNDWKGTSSEKGTLAERPLLSVDYTDAVNDPPILITNNPLNVPEEATRTITSAYLSASDSDNSATEIVYTLTELPGGTGSVHLNGLALGPGGIFTQDDIDNNRLTFVFSDDESDTGFKFTVSDGMVTLPESTFSINGAPTANDAPFNIVPGTQTVAEETGAAISGISIGDIDAAGANLTTRLQVTAGTLNLVLSGSASISAGSNGSADLTVVGTIVDINNTLSNLTYTGNTDVAGTAADTLTVTTNDGGNSGSGGARQAVDTVQIDITNTNDAPTQSGTFNLGATGIDTTSIGLRVSSIITGISADDADGDTLGIAVFTKSGLGNWEYSMDSTDGGDGSWVGFGALNPNAALLLSEAAWIRYVPDGVNVETANFNFRAWDQTADTASTALIRSHGDTTSGGGTSAYGSGAAAAEMTVALAIVDARDDSYATNENSVLSVSASGVLGNDFTTGPPEITAGALLQYVAWEDTDGNDIWEDDTGVAGFDIDFGGATIARDTALLNAQPGILAAYVFNGSGGGETPDGLNALPGDPSNGPASFEFWIRPSDASGTELIFDTGNALLDGASLRLNDSTLEWVVWNGVDAVSATQDITAEIASGEFIQVVASIDPGNFDTVSLHVNGGPAVTGTNLSVTDWSTNPAPTGMGQIGGPATVALPPAVADPFEGEIAVYRFYGSQLSDPEVQKNYEAVNVEVLSHDAVSASGASVNVNADGSFTYDPGSVFDYLAAGQTASDTFSYSAQDTGGLTDTANVTITITGENDAPTVGAVVSSAGEDAAGYLVDLLGNSADPDTSDSLSVSNLSLVSGDAVGITDNGDGTLTVNPGAYNGLAIGENEVITYSYDVSDGMLAGGTTVQITIIGANDAPGIISDGGGVAAALTIDENTSSATDVDATDIDGDSVTYRIAGGADQALFDINPSSGMLRFVTGQNYEQPTDADRDGVYEVQVAADDGNGGQVLQSLSIRILDVNEVPEGVTFAGNPLPHDADGNLEYPAGLLTAQDQDIGDTATYSIVGGADQASFRIVDGNVLKIDAGALGDTSEGSFDLVMRVTDSQGLSLDVPMNIKVTKEPPPVLTGTTDTDLPTGPAVELIIGLRDIGNEDSETPATEVAEVDSVDEEVQTDSAGFSTGSVEDPTSREILLDTTNTMPKSYGSSTANSGIGLDSLRGMLLNMRKAMGVPEGVVAPMIAVEEADDRLVAAFASIDDMRMVYNDMRHDVEQRNQLDSVFVGSGVFASTTLSVGYVVWLLRGGILASSVLSSLPAWQFLDPLPVLARLNNAEEEDEESLDSIIKKQEQKADNRLNDAAVPV